MVDAFQAALLGVKDAPGWKLYWTLRGGAFLPEFKAFVEDTVANDTRVIEPIYENAANTDPSV